MRLIPTLLLTLVCVGCDSSRPAPQAVPAAPPAPASTPTTPTVATPAPAPVDAPVAVTAAAQPADPVLAAIDAALARANVDTASPKWRLAVPKPTLAPTYDPARTYLWTLDTTAGRIVVKLDPAAAPAHVTSTIWLTRLGFYDQLAFHRVITGFMAQGGCPLGTGTGGPGYTYAGEFLTKRRHDRPGLLSMANAGPGTDGSQFFLTFLPTPWLDGKHTIFGEVVEGMEAVKTLENAGSQGGRPTTAHRITAATVAVR
jgi:peptidyl-prolyl cis-trans isomerase B (cyclophilin B)